MNPFAFLNIFRCFYEITLSDKPQFKGMSEDCSDLEQRWTTYVKDTLFDPKPNVGSNSEPEYPVIMAIDVKKHEFTSPKLLDIVDDAINFFVSTPTYPLPPTDSFVGPGVYALYYCGDGKLYGELGRLNKSTCTIPIYVGKAVPPGARTARATVSQTEDLYRRLREHASNLTQVGFDQREFKCRFMIMQSNVSPLIATIESVLFRRYQPIWNVAVDGFGNHDPGAGRYNQAPSEWDVLHPGRYWAKRCKGQAPSKSAVELRIYKLLSQLGKDAIGKGARK